MNNNCYTTHNIQLNADVCKNEQPLHTIGSMQCHELQMKWMTLRERKFDWSWYKQQPLNSVNKGADGWEVKSRISESFSCDLRNKEKHILLSLSMLLCSAGVAKREGKSLKMYF